MLHDNFAALPLIRRFIRYLEEINPIRPRRNVNGKRLFNIKVVPFANGMSKKWLLY
jgi:hypothetical protein